MLIISFVNTQLTLPFPVLTLLDVYRTSYSIEYDNTLLFQATLESNKLDLAWTLLRKQRKDASVQKLDKKGRNLLHLLAIHSAKLWTQVVEKVIDKFLVEKEI